MTFGKSTLRAAAIAAAIAIACAIPAVAMAELGDYYNPDPIVVPSHVDGTLITDTESTYGMYYYSFHLDQAQTISATFTADAANGVIADGEGDDYKYAQWSDYVADGVENLSLVAPADGTYYMGTWGEHVGSTFSFDISVVATRTFTLSSADVPKSAKVKKKFTVSETMRPGYNGLTYPIRFFIQKKASNGKYKAYTDKVATSKKRNDAGTYAKFSLKTSLSKKGTYRIRARFKDAAHSSKYTKYKTIKIK